MPSLSIVMPVYNEGVRLHAAVKALGAVDMPVPMELIICDDGSTDDAVHAVSRDWVPNAERVRVVRARVNRGKGSALRRGFALADGDILGVLDADEEYDPAEIPALIRPLLEGDAEAVFGTREFGAHAAYSFWYVLGNRLVSLVASLLFNRYVTDVYTCYKFFTRDLFRQLALSADGFEIEAELTAGILGTGYRVYELPISYRARSRDQGKKIKAIDGVKGVARLVVLRVQQAA
jgi:dolichol-phosphate hexosyltransferase